MVRAFGQRSGRKARMESIILSMEHRNELSFTYVMRGEEGVIYSRE